MFGHGSGDLRVKRGCKGKNWVEPTPRRQNTPQNRSGFLARRGAGEPGKTKRNRLKMRGPILWPDRPPPRANNGVSRQPLEMAARCCLIYRCPDIWQEACGEFFGIFFLPRQSKHTRAQEVDLQQLTKIPECPALAWSLLSWKGTDQALVFSFSPPIHPIRPRRRTVWLVSRPSGKVGQNPKQRERPPLGGRRGRRARGIQGFVSGNKHHFNGALLVNRQYRNRGSVATTLDPRFNRASR